MLGHVLIIPYRSVQRLTDLTPAEVSDVFTTVQKVQNMLASLYFGEPGPWSDSTPGKIEDGSFNIAIQDGRDAGQTVPHVHCHIIPRRKGSAEGDGIYDRLQGEQGNIGGGLWDQSRPTPTGKFPKIEDADRKPRSKEEMKIEAALFRKHIELVNSD